jgi:hypothetical protein
METGAAEHLSVAQSAFVIRLLKEEGMPTGLEVKFLFLIVSCG